MAQVREKTIAEKNERITFQKNKVEVDEYRNHTSSWNDYFTAWAYASTYIANEEESAITSDERRITFHVRWCSELSKSHQMATAYFFEAMCITSFRWIS